MRLEKKHLFFLKLTPLFPKTPQHLRFALSDIFNKIKYISFVWQPVCIGVL